jgi:hypothetical protein
LRLAAAIIVITDKPIALFQLQRLRLSTFPGIFTPSICIDKEASGFGFMRTTVYIISNVGCFELSVVRGLWIRWDNIHKCACSCNCCRGNVVTVFNAKMLLWMLTGMLTDVR